MQITIKTNDTIHSVRMTFFMVGVIPVKSATMLREKLATEIKAVIQATT